MKTYKNKEGVLVTDTRIITEEFKEANKNFRHFNLMRVVEDILDIEKVGLFGESNFDSDKLDSPKSPTYSIENHIISSSYRKYKNGDKYEKMYQLSEYGFVLLIGQMDIPRLKEVASKLYSIRKNFIHEFFRLREENKQLKRTISDLTGEEIHAIVAPKTVGKKSVVNGEKREKWVRGYARSTAGSQDGIKVIVGTQKSLFDL